MGAEPEILKLVGTGILLPIGVSIFSSFLFWFITFKHTDIKILFADYIDKRKDSFQGQEPCYKYKIRICNTGRRELIELTIFAKLMIEMAPGVENTAYFTVGDEVLPRLKNRISRKEARSLGRYDRRTNRYRRYFQYMGTIYSNASVYNEFSKMLYTESIRDKAKAEKLVIDDIFEAYPDAVLEFYVFGNDSLTGAWKMFVSKRYGKSDIIVGTYHSVRGIHETGWARWSRKKRHALLQKEISAIDNPQRILKMFLDFPVSSSQDIIDFFAEENRAKLYCGSRKRKQAFVYFPGIKKDKILLIAYADTIWDAQYTGQCYNQIIVDTNGAYEGTNPECGIGAESRVGCAILYLLLRSGHSILLLDGQGAGQSGAQYLKEAHPEIVEELGNHQYAFQLGPRSPSSPILFTKTCRLNLGSCCCHINTSMEKVDVHKWLCIFDSIKEFLK